MRGLGRGGRREGGRMGSRGEMILGGWMMRKGRGRGCIRILGRGVGRKEGMIGVIVTIGVIGVIEVIGMIGMIGEIGMKGVIGIRGMEAGRREITLIGMRGEKGMRISKGKGREMRSLRMSRRNTDFDFE